MAGSVPPVLCPHLKGRPPKHTSVKTALLTEHVPGDQHRGGGGEGCVLLGTGGDSRRPEASPGLQETHFEVDSKNSSGT